MGMRVWKRTGARTLYRKLLLVYVFTLLAAMLIAHGENILVLNIPFNELRSFYTPASFGSAILVAILMTVWSVKCLQPAFAIEEPPHSIHKEHKTDHLERLLRHPYELLIGFTLFGGICSLLYHIVEIGYARINHTVAAEIKWLELFAVMAGEAGMTLAIAVFLFTTVQRLLRPYVLEFMQQSALTGKKVSFVVPLIVTYSSTFLMTVLNLFQLAVNSDGSGHSRNPLLVGLIALFFFLLGIALFGYITFQFKSELRSLIEHIQELGLRGRDKVGIRMPVMSNDEAGELAAVFNELQARTDREYEAIERELKLAYNVQQKLLPPGDLTIGAYRITARCRPYREVGGDFFDVVMLGPHKFAVMIGDVSGKGVPAALLMSALLVLFRAEIKRNGAPGEVLARMNRQLCEAMGDDGAVTIGVGIIDSLHDTLQYASAGHLSPYIVSANGQLSAIESSSLPIGFDTDMVYREQTLQLQPGDRLILYTDGIIESLDGRGRMYGFEGLEKEIVSWHMIDNLPKIVDEWLERMDNRTKSENDDRTIVVLELVQAYLSEAVQRGARTSAIGDEQFSKMPAGHMFTHETALRSKAGTERQAAEEVGGFIVKCWPETGLREDVQTSVSEAIMNAMEHGNKFDPMTQVVIQVQIGSLLAVIRIYDEGGGYFPRVSRDEEEMAKKRESDDPRGWGLVIIDSLADYWATGRDERGFYMELYFMRKMDTEREQQGV
ncbi:SpoIIE family protein phosphatase [Paenibacillus sp. GCM10027626]|uniref:ATP-binding SpoIIE family protein phosphatase n=1 Tax=Paenibacillus sp. GCM10027626 TaxID=3273411 RepID=UPI0036456395